MWMVKISEKHITFSYISLAFMHALWFSHSQELSRVLLKICKQTSKMSSSDEEQEGVVVQSTGETESTSFKDLVSEVVIVLTVLTPVE